MYKTNHRHNKCFIAGAINLGGVNVFIPGANSGPDRMILDKQARPMNEVDGTRRRLIVIDNGIMKLVISVFTDRILVSVFSDRIFHSKFQQWHVYTRVCVDGIP